MPGSVATTTFKVKSPRNTRSEPTMVRVEKPKRLSPKSGITAVIVDSQTTHSHRPTNVAVTNSSEEDAHEHQWVYATALSNLTSRDTSEIVVRKGERALFVYPMTAELDTERVYMRVKSVNGMTGQLSYHSVLVYDPNDDKRYVVDFSLIP